MSAVVQLSSPPPIRFARRYSHFQSGFSASNSRQRSALRTEPGSVRRFFPPAFPRPRGGCRATPSPAASAARQPPSGLYQASGASAAMPRFRSPESESISRSSVSCVETTPVGSFAPESEVTVCELSQLLRSSPGQSVDPGGGVTRRHLTILRDQNDPISGAAGYLLITRCSDRRTLTPPAGLSNQLRPSDSHWEGEKRTDSHSEGLHLGD